MLFNKMKSLEFIHPVIDFALDNKFYQPDIFDYLVSNPNVSYNLILKHRRHFNYPNLISLNPNVPFEAIRSNPKRWNIFNILKCNKYISVDDILSNPDIFKIKFNDPILSNYSYIFISNPAIIFRAKQIELFCDKAFCKKLSPKLYISNPNMISSEININDIVFDYSKNKYNSQYMHNILRHPHIGPDIFIENNMMRKSNYNLNYNQNLTWKIFMSNRDIFDTYHIIKNPNVDINIDDLHLITDNYNWLFVIMENNNMSKDDYIIIIRMIIEMIIAERFDDFDIKDLVKRYHIHCLKLYTYNNHGSFSPDDKRFILCSLLQYQLRHIIASPNIDFNDLTDMSTLYNDLYWNLGLYIQNPNLTIDIILANPNINWDWLALGSNKFSYHDYYQMPIYKKKLIKQFLDLSYTELIKKSCAPYRICNYDENFCEMFPDEYNIECQKHVSKYKQIETYDIKVLTM